jgi:hypothetical protein
MVETPSKELLKQGVNVKPLGGGTKVWNMGVAHGCGRAWSYLFNGVYL